MAPGAVYPEEYKVVDTTLVSHVPTVHSLNGWKQNFRTSFLICDCSRTLTRDEIYRIIG